MDFVFPKSCLECNQKGHYICDNCLQTVRKGKVDFENNNFSVFRYEGVIRKAIIKLKYNFVSDIANELVDRLYLNFKFPIKIVNSVLVPVPLHRRRENWRGYNQATILGRLYAEKKGWGFEDNLLVRTKFSTPQAQLNRQNRLRNIRGKYAVNMTVFPKYKDSDLIVFDDVITTGATINECKKVLQKAGAKNVIGLGVCS